MTPEQISDNVKRLRDLNAKRPSSGKVINFSVKLKQTWDKEACQSFTNTMDRACAYSDAIQTINALVDLVGEVREALLMRERFSPILEKTTTIAALKEKV